MTDPAGPAKDADEPRRETEEGIGLAHGVALYLCAVLGAGVLVFPGQTASLAGPAALCAWLLSALMGLPLAFTFATLATEFPDAGGVSTFATRAFGEPAGGIAGWWYFIAGSVGQTIVPLTGGYYVVDAMGVDQRFATLAAGAILVVAVGANLGGVRLGARVQIALALAVAVILVAVVVVAIPAVRWSAFTPFAPHGVVGVGRAVVVLFFAFAGWEAIAHLASEFRDVGRTLPLATVLTVAIVTVLYLSTAAVVVGAHAYGSREKDRVALGLLVQHGAGLSATKAVAVAAVVICLGTTNAFIASISRLGFALGRDGWAPRQLRSRDAHGTPVASVLAVGGIGGAGLLAASVFGWGTEDIVFVPSTLVLATYLVASAAAARLFRGRRRVLAVVTFLLLLFIAPFAGWHLLLPVGIAALVGSLARGRPRSGSSDHDRARTAT